MDDAHMKAWQRLKKQLMERQRALDSQIAEGAHHMSDYEYDKFTNEVAGIDDDINKVEELFIC